MATNQDIDTSQPSPFYTLTSNTTTERRGLFEDGWYDIRFWYHIYVPHATPPAPRRSAVQAPPTPAPLGSRTTTVIFNALISLALLGIGICAQLAVVTTIYTGRWALGLLGKPFSTTSFNLSDLRPSPSILLLPALQLSFFLWKWSSHRDFRRAVVRMYCFTAYPYGAIVAGLWFLYSVILIFGGMFALGVVILGTTLPFS